MRILADKNLRFVRVIGGFGFIFRHPFGRVTRQIHIQMIAVLPQKPQFIFFARTRTKLGLAVSNAVRRYRERTAVGSGDLHGLAGRRGVRSPGQRVGFIFRPDHPVILESHRLADIAVVLRRFEPAVKPINLLVGISRAGVRLSISIHRHRSRIHKGARVGDRIGRDRFDNINVGVIDREIKADAVLILVGIGADVVVIDFSIGVAAGSIFTILLKTAEDSLRFCGSYALAAGDKTGSQAVTVKPPDKFLPAHPGMALIVKIIDIGIVHFRHQHKVAAGIIVQMSDEGRAGFSGAPQVKAVDARKICPGAEIFAYF